jgi:hypothetical protein
LVPTEPGIGELYDAIVKALPDYDADTIFDSVVKSLGHTVITANKKSRNPLKYVQISPGQMIYIDPEMGLRGVTSQRTN